MKPSKRKKKFMKKMWANYYLHSDSLVMHRTKKSAKKLLSPELGRTIRILVKEL